MIAYVMIFLLIFFTSLVIQAIMAWGFVRCLRKRATEFIDDDDCLPAVIILCLRGNDPFLRACLEGILRQDYPRFQIFFVVDHCEDPALHVVQSVMMQSGFERWRVEILNSPLDSCSLKCASLIQAVAALPSDTHFIAQLDADTIPHRTWLRELAGALAPADVGAATGNRWYSPSSSSVGAQVRKLWNAAAIVQMYWYSIAWGGTLAIKVDVIHKAMLIDRWSRSFCEDTLLRSQLANVGLRIAFVPTLMMANREDCTLRALVPWLTRQLLTVKLHHPAWSAVVLHGLGTIILHLGAAVLLVIAVWRSDWYAAIGLMLSLLAFQIAMAMLLSWLQGVISEVLLDRCDQEKAPKLRIGHPRILALVCVTQLIQAIALAKAILLKRVNWRGIDYSIAGGGKITRLNYAPYHGNNGEPSARSL